MNRKLYLVVSARIIALFTIAMFWSYVPELTPEFFGITGNPEIRIDYNSRYVWWCTMNGCLFIWNIIDMIGQAVRIYYHAIRTKEEKDVIKL